MDKKCNVDYFRATRVIGDEQTEKEGMGMSAERLSSDVICSAKGYNILPRRLEIWPRRHYLGMMRYLNARQDISRCIDVVAALVDGARRNPYSIYA